MILIEEFNHIPEAAPQSIQNPIEYIRIGRMRGRLLSEKGKWGEFVEAAQPGIE
jgi:hypothetical protein